MKITPICMFDLMQINMSFKVNIYSDYGVGTKWFGIDPPVFKEVIYRIKVIPKVIDKPKSNV